VAAKNRVTLPAEPAIDAEIDLGATHGVFGLAARLKVSLPGIEAQAAQAHAKYLSQFNKFIWHQASPKWNFDDATYARTAASFNNPDHVDIVMHDYRWRLGLADGESKYDDLERRLAALAPITVPAITMEGDANGAIHAPAAAYRNRFSGKTITASSRAASATIFRRRLRRLLPRPSST
jgi:hypothetical protein